MRRISKNFGGFPGISMGFCSITGFLRIFKSFPGIRFIRAREVCVQGSRVSTVKNFRSFDFEILGIGFGLQPWAAAPKAHASQSIETLQIPQKPFKTIHTIKTLPTPTLQNPVKALTNPTKAIQNPTEALRRHIKPFKILPDALGTARYPMKATENSRQTTSKPQKS